MSTRPFTREQIDKEAMSIAPPIMRPGVPQEQQNETDGLLAIRNSKKYVHIPDEMFWYIKNNWVDRDSSSYPTRIEDRYRSLGYKRDARGNFIIPRI